MADMNGMNNHSIPYGQMNLFNTLRKLLLELSMWRRAYLVSYASNSGDLAAVGSKLYSMPTSIGDVLEVFFGRTIARRIEIMIRQQIIIGSEILRAEKEGNIEEINESTKRLYQNASQMADYLAQINPDWEEQKWNDLLYEYYETTILEMVAVLAGKYEESIVLFEAMENQALGIADYLVQGIIPYFTK